MVIAVDACGGCAGERVGGNSRCNGLDGVEGFVERAGGVVLAEFDAFEERLVVEPPDGWCGGEVAVMAVLGVLERNVEVVLDLGAGRGRSVHLVVDAGQLAGDPVLFGLEQIERDGVGVVSAEKLGAFGEQSVLLRGEVTVLFLVGFSAGG
ncbi:hypothetical protein [Gordonia sp. (in: high G+C Gram-positive bacteria)]|uniref:hypothetical protein n=1 Tax=Gordonia sp. (in: high G+C Gram-positive bacteria) TaxID=84139 RepID=UPI00257EDE58|nr:hypothetical protein [Gordonia sp. (in: high G+C Gram-positive bacteria)]